MMTFRFPPFNIPSFPFPPFRFSGRAFLILFIALLFTGGFSATGYAQGDPKEIQEEKKEDAKPKEEEPAAGNPVQNLIKGLFRPRQNQPRKPILPKPEDPPTETPAEKEKSVTITDHIDERAPHDLKQAQRLEKAEEFLREGQPQLALSRIVDVLNAPMGSTIRLENGRCLSSHGEANRLLSQFPKATLQLYQDQFDGLSKQLYKEAIEKNDIDAIAEVATQYFHTHSGYQAANYLGSLHADWGEHGLAARWFEKLREAQAPMTKTPLWKLKYSLTLKRAGREEDAEKIVGQLAGLLPGGTLDIAGDSIQVEEWLQKLPKKDGPSTVAVDDWPMLYGSPMRNGQLAGGTPLLLPRWTQATTHRHEVVTQMELLLEELGDRGLATIPAFQPIAVDGKVIFRTLRGIQVVDVESGKSLWEGLEGLSPERVIQGKLPRELEENLTPEQQKNVQKISTYSQYTGGSGDRHPLASLLYRNGTYGLLSSDGHSVFVIENHAVLQQQQPGNIWGDGPNSRDPYLRDWTSNQISAYDLKDGHVRWQIGGRKTNEVFESPLAGYYFFGPPVRDGNELFVIGEGADDVRLFALNPENGKPNWSTLLSYVDATIDRDYGRRWWTAQISIGNGVIVCPTTMGWMVAIDRRNHSILWAHRYTKPAAPKRYRSSNQNYVRATPLNEQWAPSAPIVVGNRVFYTPSEHEELICLDLNEGKVIWKRSKSSLLYLAGLHEDNLILVGTDRVVGVSQNDGDTTWTLALPNSEGVRPTGFGTISGDEFLLPLSQGNLWIVDLKAGKAQKKFSFASDRRPLGNLLLYRGQLLSLNVFGMTSFEQREAMESEIQQRMAKNPTDAWALLRQADIAALNQEYLDALEDLRQINEGQLSADLQTHYRELMLDSLAALIRKTLKENSSQELLKELEAFATTTGERINYQRLQAEWHLARQQQSEAFEIYWTLFTQSDLKQPIEGTHKDVDVQLGSWLAGRFEDFWKTLSTTEQSEFEARVKIAMQAVFKESSEQKREFLQVWGFLPQSRELAWNLIDEAMARNDFAAAEGQLLQLTFIENKPDAAKALLKLAALYRQSQQADLRDDSDFLLEILQSHYQGTNLPEGESVEKAVAALTSTSPAQAVKPAEPHWADQGVTYSRTGTGYYYYGNSSTTSRPVLDNSTQLPLLQKYRTFVRNGRLQVINADDESVAWTVPLRSRNRSQQGSNVASWSVGHQLFILHQDVMHCLNPVSREVVWTYVLPPSHSRQGYHRPQVDTSLTAMNDGTQMVSSRSILNRGNYNGMLAFANSQHVCLYGQRQFSVLDAQTGEELWVRKNFPQNARLFGTAGRIYQLDDSSSSQMKVFRASDGKELPLTNAATIRKLLNQTIYATGNGFVLFEAIERKSFLGLTRPKIQIRLFNPDNNEDIWKLSFATGTLFSALPGGQLVALERDGKLSVVNLEYGLATVVGKLSDDTRKTTRQIFALKDREFLYLISTNNSTKATTTAERITSLRVNGEISAFNLNSRKLAWSRSVGDHYLVRKEFEDLPFLLFLSRKHIRKSSRIYYYEVDVQVRSKHTGKLVLHEKVPSRSNFRYLSLHLKDKFVDLRSSTYEGERLRLIAGKSPVIAERPQKGNPADEEDAQQEGKAEVHEHQAFKRNGIFQRDLNEIDEDIPVLEEVEGLEVFQRIQDFK